MKEIQSQKCFCSLWQVSNEHFTYTWNLSTKVFHLTKYAMLYRTDAPAQSTLLCYSTSHSGRLHLQSTDRQHSISHDVACLLPAYSTREGTNPGYSPRSLSAQPGLQMGTTKVCEHFRWSTEEYFNRVTSWDESEPRRTRDSAEREQQQQQQSSGERGTKGSVSAVVVWMESRLTFMPGGLKLLKFGSILR